MYSPKGRILYTEDDYDCREMVLFTLRQKSYQVTCVDTGTEALSLAKNEPFDLFLVDNWLPGLSGPELTRHIREFNQVTPILFYSGIGMLRRFRMSILNNFAVSFSWLAFAARYER